MRSPLVRTALALLGAQATGRVVRVLYLVAIARLLEPAAVGLYAYGMALYLSLIVFATFGQNLLLSTRVRRNNALGRNILINSLAVRAVTAVGATAAGAAVVLLTETERASLLPVLLFVATILPRSVVNAVRETYIARERAAWIPRYELSFRGLEAAVGTAMLLAGSGIAVVAALHLGAYGLEAGLSWRRLARDPAIPMGRRISRRMARVIAAISMVFVASLGLLNLYGQLGVLLLKLSGVDIAAIGQFGIAMQLLMTILILPTVLGNALVPAITRVRQGGGRKELDALTTLIKLTLLSGLVIALLADVFALSVVPLVLGERFSQAAELFALLCWATGPYAAAIIAFQSLNALERRGQSAVLALIMNASLAVSLAVLAPGGAATAAAISVIVSSVTGCSFGVFALRSRVGAEGNRWWAVPAGLTLLAFVAVRTVDAPLPATALAILACVGVVLHVLRLVHPSEASFIAERLGGRPLRIR